MIVLRINGSSDLPTGWTHDKTDWQVANDINFDDIVVESLDDDVHLTTIIFNEELDLDKQYYGRARMLLNTGFTEWSNIDVFIPKDANEVALNMDIPSVISAPSLSTKYEYDSHPNSQFVITSSQFSTLGNAEHISTTWIIEDSDGTALWASLNDKDNLTSIKIDKLLPSNRVCHLRCCYHGSNGNTSQFGTISVYNSHSGLIPLRMLFIYVDPDEDLEVELPPIPDLDWLEWEIYKDGEKLDGERIGDEFFTIDEGYLEPSVMILLRVRAKIDGIVGEWSYSYIEPFNADKDFNEGENTPYLGEDDNEVSDVIYPLPLPYKFR